MIAKITHNWSYILSVFHIQLGISKCNMKCYLHNVIRLNMFEVPDTNSNYTASVNLSHKPLPSDNSRYSVASRFEILPELHFLNLKHYINR